MFSLGPSFLLFHANPEAILRPKTQILVGKVIQGMSIFRIVRKKNFLSSQKYNRFTVNIWPSKVWPLTLDQVKFHMTVRKFLRQFFWPSNIRQMFLEDYFFWFFSVVFCTLVAEEGWWTLLVCSCCKFLIAQLLIVQTWSPPLGSLGSLRSLYPLNLDLCLPELQNPLRFLWFGLFLGFVWLLVVQPHYTPFHSAQHIHSFDLGLTCSLKHQVQANEDPGLCTVEPFHLYTEFDRLVKRATWKLDQQTGQELDENSDFVKFAWNPKPRVKRQRLDGQAFTMNQYNMRTNNSLQISPREHLWAVQF